ncbi:MAG: hypothetical protein AAGD32_07005 [Planctomycetota bacterium]
MVWALSFGRAGAMLSEVPRRSRWIPALVCTAYATVTLLGVALLGLAGTPAGAELSAARSVFAATNAASGSGLPTGYTFNVLGTAVVWTLGIGGMFAVLWPLLGGRAAWLLPLAIVSPSGFATWGTASAWIGVPVALVVSTSALWLAKGSTTEPRRFRAYWLLLPIAFFPLAIRVLLTGTTVQDTALMTLLTLLHVGGVAILVRPKPWLAGVLVLYTLTSMFLLATEPNVPPMRVLTLSASAASTGGTDVGPINVSDNALLALGVTQTLAKCWALWLVWTRVPLADRWAGRPASAQALSGPAPEPDAS